MPIFPQIIYVIDTAIKKAKRNTSKTSKSKSQKEVIREHYIDAIELVTGKSYQEVERLAKYGIYSYDQRGYFYKMRPFVGQ